MERYGLSEYDASRLTATPAIASYYEEALQELETLPSAARENGASAKAVANWTITELGRLLNASNLPIDESPLRPRQLADLLGLLAEGTIGTPQAKTAFEAMFRTGKGVHAVVQELGLAQITDTGAISEAVEQAVRDNPKAVEDYYRGKDTAIKFLVGQVMKLTSGKANPSLVSDLVREQLEALRT